MIKDDLFVRYDNNVEDRSTPLAVCLMIDDKLVWIPRSQILKMTASRAGWR